MIHDGTIIIDSQLLKLIAELDEFKGRWEALGRLSPEKLSSLRRVSTIESVGSSTRIEGARLSDHAVETLLANLQMHSFRSRDEEEAAGYAEAMNTVLESYEDIPFTENHIRQLHGILLRHSAKDSSHRGEYKKFPNHVVAFDADGNSLGVIFETASPFDTPRRMAELMDWANAAFAEREPHPLLAIAAFVVHFLAIHPYQDGNGRLSRVLTTLMLLKHGYLYVPYSSLERIVEENKDAYYRALRASQKSIGSNEENLDDWVRFFLRTLKQQKDKARQQEEQARLQREQERKAQQDRKSVV